jgi:putative DNA primase/helicase
MSNVDRALAIALLGPILPVKLVPDPRPDDPDHLDKRPLIKGWPVEASQDPETIRGWSQQFPYAVVGLLTGKRSGKIVVDIDDLLELKVSGLDLSDGVAVPTHRPGGTHYYFALPRSGKLPPGIADGKIDCRSEGNFVVVWGDPPDESMLKPLPEAVAQFFIDRRIRRPAGNDRDPEIIAEGERNGSLASLAGTMRRRGMSEAAIRAALLEENETRCRPPLPTEEVGAIAASIALYDPEPKALPGATVVSLSEHLSDDGNALRLVANFGDIICYVPELGREGRDGWYIWDGSRWVKDTNGYIMELCKQTAHRILEELAGVLEQGRGSFEAEREYRRWAKTSESLAKLRAMRTLASTNDDVVVNAAKLDTNKKLLNCPNGTIDLETHTLREPDEEDRITKSTRFEYHPDAQFPEWAGFLKWLTLGRAGLEEYLQRLLGYSLEGGNPERIVLLLYGIGWNGKSTLLKTVRAVLGDYAKRVDKKTFLVSGDGGTASPYVAQLPGLRFIYTSETEEGNR